MIAAPEAIHDFAVATSLVAAGAGELELELTQAERMRRVIKNRTPRL